MPTVVRCRMERNRRRDNDPGADAAIDVPKPCPYKPALPTGRLTQAHPPVCMQGRTAMAAVQGFGE